MLETQKHLPTVKIKNTNAAEYTFTSTSVICANEEEGEMLRWQLYELEMLM